MQLKKLCLAALAGLLVWTSAPAADFKFGYVDTERVTREGAPFITILKKLDKEFATRRAEIDRIEKRGKELQNTLARTDLAAADRKSYERELDALDRDYRAKRSELFEDYNQRRNEEFTSILERANRIVKQIAQREQYDLILQDAVYANSRFDLTGKVLKELEK